MKKIMFALAFFSATTFAFAQEKGMHFEHNTTWAKILAKAKAEHKYIFVDCFTTWCGPCKQMSANIFPTKEVGDFYNKNFINVKLQLDTLKDKATGKILDNDEVKSWYVTGDEIEAKYNVKVYPTYLFFDPNGQIVHRAVGSSPAEVFLAKGADALDANKQYYALKRKYENGQKDDKFLYTLAKAANEAYDNPFSKTITDTYLATQTDLLTTENIGFLADNIKSSKDKGFTELLNNPEAFDKVAGEGFAASTLRNIVIREEVLPIIAPKGGKAPESSDWDAALASATAKYPKQGAEATAFYKISYYQRKGEWNNFGPAVVEYMKAYGSNASSTQLNSFAWTVFENCDDMTCVASALDWSKKSFEKDNNHMFMDTYANLLYKSGKQKEAIEWETKAKDLAVKAGEDSKEYAATIEKMQKGEKTW